MTFIQTDIGTEEFQRLKALYGPLADAVRDLLDATIRTEVDDDTIRSVQVDIEALTVRLRAKQLEGPFGVRYVADGRGMPWGNPVIGLRNAIAPPLTITRDSDGLCWTEFTLGAAYEGPPGLVHGGISALILDHILGEAASNGPEKPALTGTITLKYLRGTPLGALRAEAFIEREEGIKTFARGYLIDDEGNKTVQADGVFILPMWARDAL